MEKRVLSCGASGKNNPLVMSGHVAARTDYVEIVQKRQAVDGIRPVLWWCN